MCLIGALLNYCFSILRYDAEDQEADSEGEEEVNGNDDDSEDDGELVIYIMIIVCKMKDTSCYLEYNNDIESNLQYSISV